MSTPNKDQMPDADRSTNPAVADEVTTAGTSAGENSTASADRAAAGAPSDERADGRTQDPIEKPKLSGKAWRDILVYTLLRFMLFLVLTFIIHSIVILLGMANTFPLLISALLALILALPLSMILFKNLRLRVTQAVAERDAGRRAHKAEMRRQLEERLG